MDNIWHVGHIKLAKSFGLTLPRQPKVRPKFNKSIAVNFKIKKKFLWPVNHVSNIQIAFHKKKYSNLWNIFSWWPAAHLSPYTWYLHILWCCFCHIALTQVVGFLHGLPNLSHDSATSTVQILAIPSKSYLKEYSTLVSSKLNITGKI